MKKNRILPTMAFAKAGVVQSPPKKVQPFFKVRLVQFRWHNSRDFIPGYLEFYPSINSGLIINRVFTFTTL